MEKKEISKISNHRLAPITLSGKKHRKCGLISVSKKKLNKKKNCYQNNNEEFFVVLFSLKMWESELDCLFFFHWPALQLTGTAKCLS